MRRDRVIEAFFSFKPAKSYRCKYPSHENKHYVDKVEVYNGRVASYLFHGHEIAILARYGDNLHRLILDNIYYHTHTIVSAMNAILSYLKHKLGVDHDVSFHLKYEKFGKPDLIYVEFSGRTYLIGRVELFFSPGVARPVIVVLDTSRQIYFFKDHPELRSIYKLYHKFTRLYNEVKALYKEYNEKTNSEAREIVRDMFRKMYGEDFSDNEYVRVTSSYSLVDSWGLVHFGLFAQYIDGEYIEVVKSFMENEIAFAEHVLGKLRRLLSIAELIR